MKKYIFFCILTLCLSLHLKKKLKKEQSRLFPKSLPIDPILNGTSYDDFKFSYRKFSLSHTELKDLFHLIAKSNLNIITKNEYTKFYTTFIYLFDQCDNDHDALIGKKEFEKCLQNNEKNETLLTRIKKVTKDKFKMTNETLLADEIFQMYKTMNKPFLNLHNFIVILRSMRSYEIVTKKNQCVDHKNIATAMKMMKHTEIQNELIMSVELAFNKTFTYFYYENKNEKDHCIDFVSFSLFEKIVTNTTYFTENQEYRQFLSLSNNAMNFFDGLVPSIEISFFSYRYHFVAHDLLDMKEFENLIKNEKFFKKIKKIKNLNTTTLFKLVDVEENGYLSTAEIMFLMKTKDIFDYIVKKKEEASFVEYNKQYLFSIDEFEIQFIEFIFKKFGFDQSFHQFLFLTIDNIKKPKITMLDEMSKYLLKNGFIISNETLSNDTTRIGNYYSTIKQLINNKDNVDKTNSVENSDDSDN